MKMEQLKKLYGDEYPVAVIVDGVRLPLRRERRFSRSYHSDQHKLGSEVSRFMDGSATITASELQREWPRWSHSERLDFCQFCCWLDKQPDFPNMLRFIMQHGDPSDWCGIAMSVATKLPRDEAFDILVRALRTAEIGRSSNIAQAIALTKHRDVDAALRGHLRAVWAHDALWNDADFINWVAFDATTCIGHLIETGAMPNDFEVKVRQLAKHPCAGNRDSCRNYLSKYYSWLA